MNLIKPAALTVILSLFLMGCSPSESPAPVDSEGVATIDLGEGDGEITLELPDFSSAGEEGEHSEEAWEKFAGIADDSKFALLQQGGVEYFPMFNEPYAMIYYPGSKAGTYWIAYYYPDTGAWDFQYDVFEMSPYNAGLELYLYNSVGERPLSGSKVLENPDGTYSVVVEEQNIKLRYAVVDGLIAGTAVFAEDTFMGYSEVTYGLDDQTRKLMLELYDIAVESGETFEIPEDKKVISEEEFNQQTTN